MENYHVLESIGEGSYGKVYKGRRKYSGQVVALKFISKTKKPEKEVTSLRREIDIMRSLRHPNIVEMLDSFDTASEVVVVTEFAQGELFQILQDDRTLPEDQVQSIAAQLVSALYYLHSRRILHRDMKPQNILLGKDGVVKLCDFGFARAMSFNTLVLTSIKVGYALYMSPELIMEQPYDHTADLWAYACILYELYTGEPPFYADGLYRLIDMVVHNPVRWPNDFPPVFRDFLERLLVKNPRRRLCWPELLDHPYVKDRAKVSEEDKNLPSPFTQAPTASLIMERERQAKERTPDPGSSKLRKFRRPDSATSKHTPKVIAWEQKQDEVAPVLPQPHPPSASAVGISETVRSSNTPMEVGEPTPRSNRISHDYSKQVVPDGGNQPKGVLVEIGGQGDGPATTKMSQSRNFDNVKLNEEDADSDDEWQSLIDATSSEKYKMEEILAIMNDAALVSRLLSRFNTSSAQVLDAILEGASCLRPVLHIINNLISLKCDAGHLLRFLNAIGFPVQLLNLIDQILQKSIVKQQAWCPQILVDLVHCLHAYFTSAETVLLISNDDVGSELPGDVNSLRPEAVEIVFQSRLSPYVDSAVHFVNLVSQLVAQKFDAKLLLREHTLHCLIYVSDLMNYYDVAQFYDVASVSPMLLESLLHCCVLEDQAIKSLEAISGGDSDMVDHHMDVVIMLGIASIAALVYPPLTPVAPSSAIKAKVAEAFGGLLCQPSMSELTSDYLLLLCHPGTCVIQLKSLYGTAQHSDAVCNYLVNSQRDLQTLIDILQGKVGFLDVDFTIAIEADLHLLTLLVLRLGHVPQLIEDAAPVILSIFLESQFASHGAAAAQLMCQLNGLGVMFDLQAEELVNAALSIFAELSQVFVRCPLGVGVLDGLMLLLSQSIAQGDLLVSSQLIENGLWAILWHRLVQTLSINATPSQPLAIQDLDSSSPKDASKIVSTYHPPDWSLLSFKGLTTAIGVATAIFIKESGQLLDCLAKSDDMVMLTLGHLVSPDFLKMLDSCVNQSAIAAVVIQTTQLFCLPMAFDASDHLLQAIQQCYSSAGLIGKLLFACVNYLQPTQLSLPMGLISRLVLVDDVFIGQFMSFINQSSRKETIHFLTACMTYEEPDNDLLSYEVLTLLSHLARSSQQHLPLLMDVCEGPLRDYQPLEKALVSTNTAAKSRACFLLGNILKHSAAFYTNLADSPKLLTSLISCLADEDPNVRKGASYSIGNAAFHSSHIYAKLGPAIPLLVRLLHDPVVKTRANASGAIGNLTINSAELCKQLVQEKAVTGVLDLACHDLHPVVQETAVKALRTMAAQPILKQELRRLNAVDRLSNATQLDENYRSASPSPRQLSTSSLMLMKSYSTMGPHGGVSARQSASGLAHHRTNLIRVLSNY